VQRGLGDVQLVGYVRIAEAVEPSALREPLGDVEDL
jgi:hypothetical protein